MVRRSAKIRETWRWLLLGAGLCLLAVWAGKKGWDYYRLQTWRHTAQEAILRRDFAQANEYLRKSLRCQ